MIEAREAIRAARALIGTPYGALDCIGLIVRVIRTAPGGVPGYRTAGTNTLWRSAESAAKYRDLTWRQEGIQGARAGMLAFKRDGENVHHVGLVTGEGTVVHSSSAKGCVVETELGGTWQLLARHRYIETGALSGPSGQLPLKGEPQIAEVGSFVDQPRPLGRGGSRRLTERAVSREGGSKEAESMATLYRATVTTDRNPLRIREAPEVGRIIGHVPRGRTVDVLSEGEWPRIRYGETVGYASADYLARVEEEQVQPGGEPESALTDPDKTWIGIESFTTLVCDDGGPGIVLGGKWRVAEYYIGGRYYKPEEMTRWGSKER